MMIRAFSFAAAVSALLPATALADEVREASCPGVVAGESSCVLDAYPVTEVKPYRAETSYGKPAVAHLTRANGAEIVVHATPGMTAEWLRHEISEHIAAAPRTGECVLDVEGVDVQVRSEGHDFVVTVIAPDSQAGREVLERARQLAI